MIQATSIAAQTNNPAVDKVLIELRATCATKEKFVVVLNGDEDHAFPVFDETKKAKRQVWIGYWRPPADIPTFPARSPTASLRLGGARTECRPAGEPRRDPTEDDTWVATFDFKCSMEKVQQIEISHLPKGLQVSYVRRSAKAGAGSVDCVEWGTPGAPIVDVQESEELRIQLGIAPPNIEKLGLLLDEKVLKQRGKLTGHTLHLDRNAVQASLRQLSGRSDAAAPTLSGVAFDIDQKKFENMHFDSIDLTVKP